MFYFTSDLHFGSEDTIKFDKRPFKNAKVFQNHIIKMWNRMLNEEDTLYIIGDFVDYHEETKDKCMKMLSLVKKIKPKVKLILGNNEERIINNLFDGNFEEFRKYCVSLGFEDVGKEEEIHINMIPFNLVHKPKHHKDTMLNLFGHSHKAIGLYKPYGFNIGCDLNNYEPYSEEDIMILLDKKEKYWDKDSNLL